MMTAAEGGESARGRSILFRIGWWVLVVLTALFTANHLVGFVAYAVVDDEQMMFLAFAGLQLLSLLVLFIPYRQRERWAWWAMWILIVVMAAPVLIFPSTLGAFYVGTAAVMALAQFATLRGFSRAR